MSHIISSISEAVERFRCYDSTLRYIDLYNKQHTDSEIAELVDCLLVHPNVVTRLYLGDNQLTDETGVKLARYLATSSSILLLHLAGNHFGMATYLALAAALRINTSLQYLSLYRNQANSIEEKNYIDAVFADALILNPIRSVHSKWYLYSNSKDFGRLKAMACELGHPSMLASLANQLIRVA